LNSKLGEYLSLASDKKGNNCITDKIASDLKLKKTRIQISRQTGFLEASLPERLCKAWENLINLADWLF